MEAILAWQLAIAASLIASRIVSSKVMITVALFWTAWTFVAVWLGDGMPPIGFRLHPVTGIRLRAGA
ncbi:hypothetical protein ACCS33_37575, partial [Rhizobium ruizarguesonis]